MHGLTVADENENCGCRHAATLCADDCRSESCTNSLQELAQGLQQVHSVYHEDVGWKVVADRDIAPGSLVMEYTGKVCQLGEMSSCCV